MSQEIAGAKGRQAEAAMNLRRSGVKPLRGPARAPEARQTFSVEELKNGGLLNLGGFQEEPGAKGAEARTIRDSGRQGSRGSARQSRAEGLPLHERLQKLAQIKKSATDYEALFVDQLVKLMRPSPLAPTPGGNILSELAEQPFRDYLSQAGGLGLANTIVAQIVRQEGLEQTLQEHPEVMGPSWRPSIPKNLGPKSSVRLSLPPAGREAKLNEAEIAEPSQRDLKGPSLLDI